MSTMQAEARVFQPGIQVRDVEATDKLTHIGGRAVPYGVQADIGWYMEEFAAGALAKSIREAAKGLPLLLFHNAQSWPIGVSESWDERSDGLHAVWKLDGSDEAQRAAQLAKDGMLGYLSIRFAPIRSEWTYVEDFNPDLGTANKDSVVRTEARLIETSLLSTPAYKDASVSFVRTGERAIHREASGKHLAGWRQELEQLRRV